MDPAVKRAIATIAENAWTPIEYTDAVYDETAGAWISRAEVAEIPFTAFSSRKIAERVTGRLIVRRIPELNPKVPTTGRPLCSIPTGSMPSSPPPEPIRWIRSPRTRPTAPTR